MHKILISIEKVFLYRRPPQLALPVEFLFEILCVEAPPQLAHYKLTLRQLL